MKAVADIINSRNKIRVYGSSHVKLENGKYYYIWVIPGFDDNVGDIVYSSFYKKYLIIVEKNNGWSKMEHRRCVTEYVFEEILEDHAKNR